MGARGIKPVRVAGTSHSSDLQSLPTLYKKTSTGALQFWSIAIMCNSDHSTAWDICTVYGQEGTDKPQTTTDTIWEGKNIGKKNETTIEQQARAEAEAKWEKQKKKGYVEYKEAAMAGELDELIEGGIVPMLAHKFSEQGHKIKYPAHVQPKLDGIRCIAVIDRGKCTLWSRTRKPIKSVPHIVKELEEIFAFQSIILDGELYNHAYKDKFEQIVSLVRQEEPDPKHEIVQYHIYDCVIDDTFKNRIGAMQVIIGKLHQKKSYTPVKCVDTFVVESEDKVMSFFNTFRALGFEGAMLRNSNSLYVNKRSYDLQKVKEFDDAEFEILGIEEGRGKLAGHVGAFICRTADGRTFLAKMSGDTAKLKEYFDKHSLWKGKLLTVQYQGLTGAEKVPRFPVGIAIRDYE